MTATAIAHSPAASASLEIRCDWTRQEILDLFALPFNDLLRRAHETHRRHFDANRVQLSTLLSIKTGGCPEDCKYCAQSVHFDTGLGAGKLMDRRRRRRAPPVSAWAPPGGSSRIATCRASRPSSAR